MNSCVLSAQSAQTGALGLEVVSASLYFASRSAVRILTKFRIVILCGNNLHTEGHDKWLSMKEDIVYGKMLGCSNKGHIRNLSRYLSKVKCKWLNKSKVL
jgi:hypothetical protein